jgi:hypothetical protein
MLHPMIHAETGRQDVEWALLRGDDLAMYDHASGVFGLDPAVPWASLTEHPTASGLYAGRFSYKVPDGWYAYAYRIAEEDHALGTEQVLVEGSDDRIEFVGGPDPIPPAPVPQLVNGTFAAPVLPPKTNHTGPPDGWVATGKATVASNGAPGTSGNSPGGWEGQFAVLEGVCTLSQAIPSWVAGTYGIYLKHAQRTPGSRHKIEVRVGGKPVASYTSSRPDFTGIMTPGFVLEAGDHELSFVGSNPDATPGATLIDVVTLARLA